MPNYQERVAERLTQVYQGHSLIQTRELSQMRLVLLSDLHKGRRDGADDFEQCEATYLAALHYYWQQGFELWLLGDIEELWENRPSPVIAAYSNVLRQEQTFAEIEVPSRYLRLIGNHDDLWYDPTEVERHLGPYLGGKQAAEAIRLAVKDNGQTLGELFLVHGHQGTLFSDRYGRLSAWIVRYIWRPIQRLLRIKTSTPSTSFRLKEQHELALYAWAAAQSDLVLIAGHTHHPVWEGLSYEQALEQRPQARQIAPEADRRWIRKQIGGRIELPGEKPAYFNSGCCSYSDGSCTGIEIEDGEIRLVRWEDPTQPARHVLFSARLIDVLQAV